MLNFPYTGTDRRLGLFTTPHAAFACLNDDERRSELERIRTQVADADLRSMRDAEEPSSVWNAPHRQFTRGVVAVSAMLAALVAVIVTSGPIQTPGPSGISMRHRDVHQSAQQHAVLISPANHAGK